MIIWPDLGLWLSWAAASPAASFGESEPQKPFGLQLRESAIRPLTVSVPAPMVGVLSPSERLSRSDPREPLGLSPISATTL